MDNKSYNVLSLFDGIGMAHQALKDAKIPINKYFSSEIDVNAIKVSNNNHKQINLGNIVDLSFKNDGIYVKNELVEKTEIDLLIGGSPCFIAGTKILTNVGYKNIEEVKIGDIVLSHTGKWRKVLNIGGKDFAPTRIIQTYGCIGVETTDEHPFYARNLTKKWNLELKKENVNLEEPKWIEAKSLSINDLCSFVKTNDDCTEHNIPEYEWILLGEDLNKTLIKNIPFNIFLETKTNKKAFLTGFFNQKELNLLDGFETISSTNIELILGIQKLIIDVYEIPVKIISNNEGYKCIIEKNTLKTKNEFSFIPFFENGYVWNLLENNTQTNKRKTVYNLEVDVDNSYTANNIVVHNCTNLSFAGKQEGLKTKCNQDILNLETYLEFKKNGFEFEGQSFLFWEYIRILREIKPTYFFLENVVMEEKWEKIFTENLGVQPIKLNSKIFTCQNRPRLYWTNIPYNKEKLPNLNLTFNSIKENSFNKKYYYSDKAIQWLINHSYRIFLKTGKIKKLKIYTDNTIINAITASHCKKYSGQRFFAILDNGVDNLIQKTKIQEIFNECQKNNDFSKLDILTNWEKILYEDYSYRYITPEECEISQGLPNGYTKGISDTSRYKAIGNGFTVSVISWFISFLGDKKNESFRLNIIKNVRQYTMDVITGRLKLPKTTPKISVQGFNGLINFLNDENILVINYIRKNKYTNLEKMSNELKIEQQKILQIINDLEHLKILLTKRQADKIIKITCKYNKIEIICPLDYI